MRSQYNLQFEVHKDKTPYLHVGHGFVDVSSEVLVHTLLSERTLSSREALGVVREIGKHKVGDNCEEDCDGSLDVEKPP